MAARPQQSADRLSGSSFTIANILNLQDDSNKSIEPIRQTLSFEVAATPKLNTDEPPPPNANRSSHSAGCWRSRSCTISFNTTFYPLGVGVTDFAREPRLSLCGLSGRDNNGGLKFRGRVPTQKKKQRLLFLPNQVQKMEKEFDSRKYLTEGRRAELAVELKLTETQVKTWFQNRRTKWRKELRNENPPREVPDGRLKYCLEARKRT